MKFLVRFVVDEPAVGPTLAALNTHDGVVFSHLSIEPLPEFKALPKPKPKPQPKGKAEPNMRRKSHLQPFTARDRVLDFLRDGKPRRTAEVDRMLKGWGFSGAGSTLRNLREDGLIEKADGRQGAWRLTQLDKTEDT